MTRKLVLISLVQTFAVLGIALPAFAAGGTAHFTNGPYDWPNSTFYYVVDGGPPNMSGTLYTYRNGSQLISPSWIQTDSNGDATKGPWTGSSNQTDEDIYILWADGSRTTGGDYHVSDATAPTISSNQSGGSGVPIPTSFDGAASDAQWGTGLNFTLYTGWSSFNITYQNLSTGLYWVPGGYTSSTPATSGASASPTKGFNISWSAFIVPPQSDHNSTDSYRWCVQTHDYFYNSNLHCVVFYGPR